MSASIYRDDKNIFQQFECHNFSNPINEHNSFQFNKAQ